jgi:two-component system, response regulator YesN
VAGKAFMDVYYFSRTFKKVVGRGFADYLKDLRLKKALDLLSNPILRIKEIASLVGYQDPNYFSRLMKKETGYSPGEYREIMLKMNLPE